MNARWAPSIVALIGFALVGCDSSQPRTVHGQINMSDYSLRQPVVLVESSNKLGYVARVSATGSFNIMVPAGQSYRLTLADRGSGGPLALVSRILWSAKGRNFVWGKVGNGSTINFGLIRPLGAVTVATANSQGLNSNSQGEDDDSQCDEDDDAQGDEQGPTGSGATCPPKMQPPTNPPLCMPGTLGTSKGDQDDDEDEDNNAQGDDDRDGNGVASAQCGDGGVMSNGDDDNQGDDNAQGNENEDDDDGHGQHCVTHVPVCPPVPPGTPPPPVTPPPMTPPGGTPPPPPVTPPPPMSPPDLGTPPTPIP
jgi:hypothetical protein